MSSPDPWTGFAHDPREAAHAGLRASDRERELVRQVLAAAFADGRLEREEYDERSDAVAAARTLGDLPPLVADLVPLHPVVRRPSDALVQAGPDDLRRRAVATWEAERRSAVLGLVGVSLVCWAIWTATSFSGGGFDADFPWPLIVSAVLVARLIRVVVTREETIVDETQRLERRQAKELERRQRRERRGRRGPEEGT